VAFPTTDVNTASGGDSLAAAFTNKVNAHFQDSEQHAPRMTANTQTGTSYTLVLADAGKVIEMNNASANTVTVPPNSSVAFPAGTIINVYRMGAGSTTVVQGSGVTVRNVGALRAQYSEASLRKRATDEWVLAGDLA
jgi:uncharacterized protein (AIM24 family)